MYHTLKIPENIWRWLSLRLLWTTCTSCIRFVAAISGSALALPWGQPLQIWNAWFILICYWVFTPLSWTMWRFLRYLWAYWSLTLISVLWCLAIWRWYLCNVFGTHSVSRIRSLSLLLFLLILQRHLDIKQILILNLLFISLLHRAVPIIRVNLVDKIILLISYCISWPRNAWASRALLLYTLWLPFILTSLKCSIINNFILNLSVPNLSSSTRLDASIRSGIRLILLPSHRNWLLGPYILHGILLINFGGCINATMFTIWWH